MEYVKTAYTFEILQSRFVEPAGWVDGPSSLTGTHSPVQCKDIGAARRSVESALDELGAEYDSDSWTRFEDRLELQATLPDDERDEPMILDAMLWVYDYSRKNVLAE
jgi:hypothetical protein